VDVVDVLDKLAAAGVSFWLDREGKLRITKDAPAELKELVRTYKLELIDIRRAQEIMNRPGMRCIRLPLGKLAVAYPLKSNIEEIRWAMRILRMDLPLVFNDEGLKWRPYLSLLDTSQKSVKTFWAKLIAPRGQPGTTRSAGHHAVSLSKVKSA
jgi:hypothetical protein